MELEFRSAVVTMLNTLGREVSRLSSQVEKFDSKLDSRNARKLLKQFKEGKKKKKR